MGLLSEDTRGTGNANTDTEDLECGSATNSFVVRHLIARRFQFLETNNDVTRAIIPISGSKCQSLLIYQRARSSGTAGVLACLRCSGEV